MHQLNADCCEGIGLIDGREKKKVVIQHMFRLRNKTIATKRNEISTKDL